MADNYDDTRVPIIVLNSSNQNSNNCTDVDFDSICDTVDTLKNSYSNDFSDNT